MTNAAFRWQARGLAGLVTMLEGEAAADPRIDRPTLQTLTTWANRLSHVLTLLSESGEGQIDLPAALGAGVRYLNR